MKPTMVRYTVKPDQVEQNETLIRQVFDELTASATPDVHYAVFALEDGVSFVHLAWSDAENDERPFMGLASFRQYVEGIEGRCQEPPVQTTFRPVGSYRVAGA